MDQNKMVVKQRRQILAVLYGTALSLLIFIALLADPKSTFLWWLVMATTCAAMALGIIILLTFYCLGKVDDNETL